MTRKTRKSKKSNKKTRKQKGGNEEMDELINSEGLNRALLMAIGVTPITEEHYQNVKYLVERGANVNIVGTDEHNLGKTPLMLIASNADDSHTQDSERIEDDNFVEYPEYKIVKLLVQNGVDVGIRDGAGRTALESTTSRQIQRLLILELMRRDNDYYENPHDIISDHFRDHALNAGRFDNDNLKESKKRLKTRLYKYTEEAKEKIRKERQSIKDRKSLEDVHEGLVSIIDTRNTLKKNNPDIINQEIEQCVMQCREKIQKKYEITPNEKALVNPDITKKMSEYLGGKTKKNKKNKKEFLYNPDDPSKSFDVYINKNPSDTIPIKYTTVKDVKDTINKLEKLYKTKKYPHKRIWQVAMIMKVRLEAIKKHEKTRYPNAKNVTSRY